MSHVSVMQGPDENVSLVRMYILQAVHLRERRPPLPPSTATLRVAVQSKRGHLAACVHNDVEYTRLLLIQAFHRVDGPTDWRHDWRLARRYDPKRTLVLQIDEYEEIIWERVLAGSLVANAYCVRKGLIRKANFARHVSKVVMKRPDSVLATAIPAGIVIETWSAFEPPSGDCFVDPASAFAACVAEAVDAMEAVPGKLWVLKPSLANKGAEVTVVRDAGAMLDVLRAWPDAREWVLQDYVDRPLTLGGRKFHIRAYVLAVGALKVFLYHEGLLLIAVHPYDREDIEDSYSHLTNTCVAADHDLFEEKQFVRKLTQLGPLLEKQGTPDGGAVAHHIVAQMRAALAHTFESFRGEFSSFMPLVNAFELFGVDFLVDETHRVQLLEFNAGPDLKQTGDRLGYVIEDMLRGMVDVVVRGGHFPGFADVAPAAWDVPVLADGVTAAPVDDVHEAPFHGWDMCYSSQWALPGGDAGIAFK